MEVVRGGGYRGGPARIQMLPSHQKLNNNLFPRLKRNTSVLRFLLFNKNISALSGIPLQG
jgi:hypothetical protein